MIELINFGNIILLLLIAALIYQSRPDENVLLKKILDKAFMYIDGIIYMVISSDNSGLGPKKNPDPALIKIDDNLKKKRFIFIRHGESDWNFIFNMSKLLIPYRLIMGMIKEFSIYPTSDSGILSYYVKIIIYNNVLFIIKII